MSRKIPARSIALAALGVILVTAATSLIVGPKGAAQTGVGAAIGAFYYLRRQYAAQDDEPKVDLKGNFRFALLVLYVAGNVVTFLKLTFFDDYRYNWWNWIIAVPMNEILAAIWPIYWAILRPLMG